MLQILISVNLVFRSFQNVPAIQLLNHLRHLTKPSIMFSKNIWLAILSLYFFLATRIWLLNLIHVLCFNDFVQVSSRMSQFWKPTTDFGELSTSLPSSRFLNDFEELKSIGKGKSLYLSFLWFYIQLSKQFYKVVQQVLNHYLS